MTSIAFSPVAGVNVDTEGDARAQMGTSHARRHFSSFFVTVRVVPTSPMKPARTPVSPMPCSMSRARMSASASTDSSATYAGWPASM